MPTATRSSQLEINSVDLNNPEIQRKVKRAIAAREPVCITVPQPMASILSAAIGDAAARQEAPPGNIPRSTNWKKEALAEAKRKAKEKALEQAKRKAKEKALGQKRKAEQRDLIRAVREEIRTAKVQANVQSLAKARSTALAAAREDLALQSLNNQAERKPFVDLQEKIIAEADDMALAEALTKALADADRSLDEAEEALNDEGALDDSNVGNGMLQPMVAGVDDAIIITAVIVAGVIAVVGMWVLADICLEAIAEEYGVEGENSGNVLDILGFKFKIVLKPSGE
jgi:hypothetical protein